MPTVPSEFQFSIASHYWFGRGQWRGKTLCRRQNRFSHCPRSATLVVVKTLFDLQELVEAGADIFLSWCCQPFHGQTTFSISYPTLPEKFAASFTTNTKLDFCFQPCLIDIPAPPLPAFPMGKQQVFLMSFGGFGGA